jgi:hypothetical protein
MDLGEYAVAILMLGFAVITRSLDLALGFGVSSGCFIYKCHRVPTLMHVTNGQSSRSPSIRNALTSRVLNLFGQYIKNFPSARLPLLCQLRNSREGYRLQLFIEPMIKPSCSVAILDFTNVTFSDTSAPIELPRLRKRLVAEGKTVLVSGVAGSRRTMKEMILFRRLGLLPPPAKRIGTVWNAI